MKVMLPPLVMDVAPLTGDQKSRSVLCHMVWVAAVFSGTVRENPAAVTVCPSADGEEAVL